MRNIASVFLLASLRLSAATVPASSCSSTDVATAIGIASSGDTVSIPSGTCSWASPVTLNKSLTILGQTTTVRDASTYSVTPTDSTIIQKNGFSVTASTGVRISGITFDGNVSGVAAQAITLPSGPVGMRIDHNHFSRHPKVWNKGVGGGYLNILFDHNRVTQPGEEALYVVGAGNQSWTDGGACSSADSSKMTWFEDNEFALVDASVGNPIDSGEGARFAFRRNLFSAPTNYAWQELIEAHGHCWGQRDGNDNASAYCQIVEGNKVQKGTAPNNGNLLLKTRGGRSYVYDNQIYGTGWANASMVRYWPQEVATNCNATPCAVAAHSGIHSVPLSTNWLCTSYPCPMQPNNSYIWGNTMESGTLGADVWDANPATYMVENRDYWSDLGATPFTKSTSGSRGGTCASNDSYWETDTRRLYRCTSTNTWTLEYAAYAYPHPLQGIPSPMTGSMSGTIH